MTGLAIAFLVVLLGSIINRAAHEQSGNAVVQASSNEPSEPLAELGVAPGASDTTNTTNNGSAKK